ncbi:MAG TPA: hypothetical protein P5183_11610, partial [Smithellaceae bacterium]|nr:hypothetical protein [Smithellaceae bacterium]
SINPKPLLSLNHFTLPSDIISILLSHKFTQSRITNMTDIKKAAKPIKSMVAAFALQMVLTQL